jgi:hypothetical protein
MKNRRSVGRPAGYLAWRTGHQTVMTTQSLTYRRITVAVIAACLMAAGCKKSAEWPNTPTTITVRFDAGERAASQTANGFLLSVRTVYSGATSPASPASQATSIRYFDAQDREQPAYNPVTTVRAFAKGTCVHTGGSTTFDLVLDDMQASSPTYLVNGSILGTYEGIATSGTLTSVRIPKQGCPYPTSGSMSVRYDQATIAVRFDGSTTVTGTYTVGGQTVTFTIPLTGC